MHRELSSSNWLLPGALVSRRQPWDGTRRSSVFENGKEGNRQNALRQLAFNQLCAPISSAKGQNVTQRVAISEGTKSDKTSVSDGVCLGLTPLVAEMKMERAKGFEPSGGKSQSAQNQYLPSITQVDYTQIHAHAADASCPDLAKVVAAWAKLPAPLKAAILAIISPSEGAR
jgi:hypothetical protein